MEEGFEQEFMPNRSEHQEGASTELSEDDVRWEYSPSGGPGGQHANRSHTRATAVLDIAACGKLTPEQRELLIARIDPAHLSGEGVIRVSSSRTRSQKANRIDALERLNGAVESALEERKSRKFSGEPRSAENVRIAEKKQRGELKRGREKIRPDHDE